MSALIMFGLGFIEIGVAVFALAGAFWIVCAALADLWALHADKVQFYLWLAKQSNKSDNQD